MTRLLVVAALVAAVLVAHRLHAAWRRGLSSRPATLPSLPSSLVAGSDRTWVVFTAPYCASCGPVIERLRAFDPTAGVVTVDAGAEAGLANAFSVRTAPTVLLADRKGQVQQRLVGAAAVHDFVDGSAPTTALATSAATHGAAETQAARPGGGWSGRAPRGWGG